MLNSEDGSLALCGARSKRNRGRPCRQPAMENGRCRLHGGYCTGPRTHEGLRRASRANWKHGFYSAKAINDRWYVRKLIREFRGFQF